MMEPRPAKKAMFICIIRSRLAYITGNYQLTELINIESFQNIGTQGVQD